MQGLPPYTNTSSRKAVINMSRQEKRPWNNWNQNLRSQKPISDHKQEVYADSDMVKKITTITRFTLVYSAVV